MGWLSSFLLYLINDVVDAKRLVLYTASSIFDLITHIQNCFSTNNFDDGI